MYEKRGLQERVTHNLSSVWKIIWRSAIIHGSVNSSSTKAVFVEKFTTASNTAQPIRIKDRNYP